MRRARFLLLVLLLLPSISRADEGFWMAEHFPAARVKEKFGVEIGPEVFDHLVKSSVSIGRHTGAFVSPRGLIVVKHGTAKGCLIGQSELRRSSGRLASLCQSQALRRALPIFDRWYCQPLDRAAGYDYLAHGHLARTAEEELRCPNLSASQLVESTDVTDRIRARSAGRPLDERLEAERQASAVVEGECRKRSQDSCQVVALHGGARFQLYRSRVYQDVRLVFAPERRVADFGDIQDHMIFPDHDFKVAFVRAYRDGRPAQTPDHLSWSTRPLKEGELTLMVGHPPYADRYALASRLERQRESGLAQLALHLEQRGLLDQLAAERPELASGFDFDDKNFSIVNNENRRQGLSDAVIRRRAEGERQLIEALARRSDPQLEEVKKALEEAARAHALFQTGKARSLALMALDWSPALDLADAALKLARPGQAERARQLLERPQSFDEEVESARLAMILRRLQEVLMPGDPLLATVTAGQSARDRAADLVHRSGLRRLSFRRRLAQGGPAAVDAARDPLIELVREIYPEIRASYLLSARAESAGWRAANLLESVRYRLGGEDVYPEGTGTIRLSYGAYRGFTEGGRAVAPLTTLGDLFALSRAHGPYQLPEAWVAARSTLDLATPLDVATTNDMIAPALLVDARGALLGMGFMGNRPSATFEEYDPRAREVSVHNAAVVEVLRRVYHAGELLEELGSTSH
jgi:hypothetical protein